MVWAVAVHKLFSSILFSLIVEFAQNVKVAFLSLPNSSPKIAPHPVSVASHFSVASVCFYPLFVQNIVAKS